ncbi:MAG: hypothetical protein ACRYGK_06775 [Janthinobacterium lividum]
MNSGGGGRDRTGVNGFAGRASNQGNQLLRSFMAKRVSYFSTFNPASHRTESINGEKKAVLLQRITARLQLFIYTVNLFVAWGGLFLETKTGNTSSWEIEDESQEMALSYEFMSKTQRATVLRYMQYCAYRPDRDTHQHMQSEIAAIFEAAKQLH